MKHRRRRWLLVYRDLDGWIYLKVSRFTRRSPEWDPIHLWTAWSEWCRRCGISYDALLADRKGIPCRGREESIRIPIWPALRLEKLRKKAG